MTAGALSPAQLRPQLRRLERRLGESRVVGVHHTGPWSGPDQLLVDGDTWQVAVCPSLLEVHAALAAREEQTRLVLVSPFEERELGVDVVSRLVARQLLRPSPLRAVLGLFAAKDIDRGVARTTWMLAELIRVAPPDGYAPVPAGSLSAERVWEELCTRALGLPNARPTLVELVRWGASPVPALADAAPELRQAVTERLTGVEGAQAVLAAVRHGGDGAAVFGGLTARLLGSSERAVGRFEQLVLGGARLIDDEEWADAAEAVVDELEKGHRQELLTRAEGLIGELDLSERVASSNVLPSAWDSRLRQLAAALDAGDGRLIEASQAVLAHRSGRARPTLPAALTALERLARRPSTTAHSLLREAVAQEIDDGGWALWARSVAVDAAIGPATDAVNRFLDRLDVERASGASAFARLAVAWDGDRDDELLGVEHVLEAVVAPTATAAPTVVVVIDGLSQAVGRELVSDIVARGWVEQRPEPWTRRRAALATLPSLTAVSRSALLSGKLGAGEGQKAERDGFASHPLLRDASGTHGAPRLIHQGALTDVGAGLSDEAASLIGSQRRVVGVVVNAVDDALGAGSQQVLHWTEDVIPVLRRLLEAAADAGRAVVLLSDHGHVLERSRTRYLDGGGSTSKGARRRSTDGNAARAEEVLATSARVLTPSGQVILAADPFVRYEAKAHAGYHGGASPEELVAPIVVLTRVDAPLEGFVDVPPDEPSWWRELEPVASPTPAPPSRGARPVRAGQLAIDGVQPSQAAAPSERPTWIAALLASDVLARQRERTGGSGVSDDRLGRILSALHGHGGTLTKAALAMTAGIPPSRLDTILSAVRPLLNVEGVQVLTGPSSGDVIELHLQALKTQFGLS